MKRIISVLLALVFVLSSFAVLAYADKKAAKLDAYILLDDGNDDTTERLVDAYEIDGEYYFFVPVSMNKFITKFVVNSDEKAYVNGKEITASTTIADAFGDKTAITVTLGNNSYTVKAIFGSAIPNVYIETPSGSLDYIHADKSNREDCLIEITDALGVTVYDGGVEVKGRGNSTWKMEKKPYNIKLDEKVNLFGMGKSKKWSLIANHTDLSLIRNAYVYAAAKAAGLDFVPQYVPCDVYINNEYMGNYILTSRVEVDKTRVNIDNLEDANEEANPDIDIEEDCKTGGVYGTFAGLLEGTSKWIEIPNEPEEISGGYILEMEISNRYKDEASGFVTKMVSLLL